MFKNATRNQSRRGVTKSRAGRSLGKKKKRRAGPPKQVLELVAAKENRKPVKVKVMGFNSGGLVMHYKGVRVFCPISQVGSRRMTPPGEFKGETWEVLVLSANKSSVVVSRELAERRTNR